MVGLLALDTGNLPLLTYSGTDGFWGDPERGDWAPDEPTDLLVSYWF